MWGGHPNGAVSRFVAGVTPEWEVTVGWLLATESNRMRNMREDDNV